MNKEHLAQYVRCHTNQLTLYSTLTHNQGARTTLKEKPFHRIIQPFYEKCFTDEEKRYLFGAYTAIIPHNVILTFSRFYKEFKTLIINGEEYISVKSRSQRSAAIIAHWPSLTGAIDTTGDAPCRVGIIQWFISHQITLDSVGSNSSMTLLAKKKSLLPLSNCRWNIV